MVEAVADTTDNEQRSVGSPTSASGFVAVNRSTREAVATNGAQPLTNGKSTATTASASTRAELLSHFNQIRASQGDLVNDVTPSNAARSYSSKTKHKQSSGSDVDYAGILLNSASPVPIPNTPSNLVHYSRPTQAERLDDSGPYKAEMLSRMETLQRGDRVLPPCDRCRRLHMDCLKNLTACQGCTRKHAKCSWKDVTEQELVDNPRAVPKEEGPLPNGEDASSTLVAPLPEGPPQPVRDEELLGEDDSDDDMMRPPTSAAQPSVELENVGLAINELPIAIPRQLDGEDEASLGQSAGDGAEPEKMDVDAHQTEAAREDVQAVARDILQKRLVEIPTANASGGVESVNRPSSASTPEVRIYEPPQELQDPPKADQPSPKVESYATEEPKTEFTYGFTAANGSTAAKSFEPEYPVYD